MTIIVMTTDIIALGAYADIFRPPGSTLVYKLFVSGKHPTNESQGLTRPQDNDRRRNTFMSECEAYDRAAQHPFLRDHISQSFRRCVVEDVTGPAGSVADRYMLDCCYAIEYIEGVPRKLGELFIESRPDHIRKALRAFREAGILHLTDPSIFFPDDPEKFRFIDFAIEEFPAVW
jgi:hypothetical protein